MDLDPERRTPGKADGVAVSARADNARMLASLVGMDEDEAAERLHCRILVTAEPGAAKTWAVSIAELLERTVIVTDSPAEADLELVVGNAAARSHAPRLFAAIDAKSAVIASKPTMLSGGRPHPLLAVVFACAAAAATLRAAIGDPRLPAVPDPLYVRVADIGLPELPVIAPIDLTGAVLVGAGAVAHGFMRALRYLPVRGQLDIVDPKTVGPSNPNRCLYLTDEDVGAPKAEALARHAAKDFPDLVLRPLVMDFKTYATRQGKVRLAVATVDSRRVRRQIQMCVPGRVVDASTTDVRAVVVHSHLQPTDHACLACTYRHVVDEEARERSIAAGLGLELNDLKKGLIDAEMAKKIVATHTEIEPGSLVGKAFDTLFRELCGAQALHTTEGRQTLTPFAFVSNLAGALAAVELVRQELGQAPTNYWQVDPWRSPLARLRQRRPRASDCQFCSRPDAADVVHDLWGSQHSVASA
jgi:molybdopterin/thiamine biosynthesis adenylyltransferase